MTDYPSESSLVVNATQQQLSMSSFNSGVAISPSQREEAKGGYDISFEAATRLELQYKAVYNRIEDRTFQRGTTQTAVKFPFNGKQAKTLLSRQTGPGTAFYALPVVLDVSGLGDVLGTTVFLDVTGLESLPKDPDDFGEYTAFWVPINGATPTFSEVYLKDKLESQYSKARAYDRIGRTYLYTWPEFERLTNANLTGVPVRVDGATTPTRGYRRLLTYESALLESRLRETSLDGQDPTQLDSWELLQSVADRIVEQSIDVGETIAEERPADDEISGELRELLNEHRYLLERDFDYERRRETVEAALISRPDRDDEESIQIDYSGLDPRRRSRHRQYRYLTSGEKAEALEVPIGFS